MSEIESNWRNSLSRRRALQSLAGFLAGSPLLRAQQDPFRDHSRVPAMNELLTAMDFEPVAYAKISRESYDYMAHGTESEFTLRRNRQAFDWVELVPKGVANVKSIETATEVLGTKMAYPIMISPSAGHLQLHPQGEPASRQGGQSASNTPMIISGNHSFPIDQIGAAAKAPMWYQLYPQQEFDENLAILDAAQSAGASTIVVTIDQMASYYERDVHDRNLGNTRFATMAGSARRARARTPSAPRNPYRVGEGRLWYNWPFVDKLRPTVKVPMLAKGVLTAEDAKLCVEHGFDGVYVSNHGGRSQDYCPSTLEVLAEVADAVQGRIPVLFDSGVRRGSDVLKALALGAKAVCLGRVPRWGLAAYGAPGVQRILEIMQAELVLAMAATGRPSLTSIDRSLVRTEFA